MLLSPFCAKIEAQGSLAVLVDLEALKARPPNSSKFFVTICSLAALSISQSKFA